MRPLREFWIAGASVLLTTGCSSFEPRENPWAGLEVEVATARPVALPAWPEIGDDLTLTPAAASALLDFAEVADANYEVAMELSKAVKELQHGHNALVRAGAAEHELAELRGLLLREERRARLWDKLLWGGIGLVGVLAR
jgi:hypothetical protein